MDAYAAGRGFSVILGTIYCIFMGAFLMYNIQSNPLVVAPPCA